MQPIKNYNNILVFNPSFIGDSVLTVPLIKALCQIYPKSRVSFCVRPESKGLFEGLPFIYEVISYDKRGSAKGIKGIKTFAAELKKRKFDLIINLHKSVRSTMLMMLSGCSDVVGFKSAVFSFLFKNTVNRNMALHEVERNLATLEVLVKDYSLQKAKIIAGTPVCFIDNDLAEKTKFYFNTVSEYKKIIGIAPGSVWATKRYPAESFAAVANMLVQKGYAVALFGSKSDKDALDLFKKHFSGSYYDFSCNTSLKELPAVLSSLDLFITNDSGPMHIASGAGVPCVAIFGATVPSIGFAPYDNKSVILQDKNLSCRPCRIHGGNKCPKKHFKCMKNISPQSVVQAAEKILGF